MKQLTEQINQLVLSECDRWNQHFIDKATRLWDIEGQGCFALFMQVVVAQMWFNMVWRN